MPAGGAGSVGTGTARTFRRIVPGGDSMVTSSSSLPLPSISAAATTVTRLRSLFAGGSAGAVGVGRRPSRRATAQVRPMSQAMSTATHRESTMAPRIRRVRAWGSPRAPPLALPTARVRARQTASGRGRPMAPARVLAMAPGSHRRRAGFPAPLPEQRILSDGRRRDHDGAGQQQCGLQQNDAGEEGSPAVRGLRHFDLLVQRKVRSLPHRSLGCEWVGRPANITTAGIRRIADRSATTSTRGCFEDSASPDAARSVSPNDVPTHAPAALQLRAKRRLAN